MTDMKHEEFTKARKDLGLTHEQLAKGTGISLRQVKNLGDESGKFRIRKPIAMLMRLLVRASKKTLKEVGFND